MNDERPIEKLLRRAAKLRSDEAGPPPKLHPANRRQLQDEVARQFPKPAAPQPSALVEFWTGLKQRWLYGVGVFALVWVVALGVAPLFSKSKSQMNLAQNAPNESRLEMEAAKNAAPAPATVAAPPVAMDLAGSRATKPRDGGNLVLAPEPAAAPPVVVALTASADREAATRRLAKDVSTIEMDSIAANGTLQQTVGAKTKTRLAGASAATESLNRSTPASMAQRTPPTRNDGFSSSSGGGNLAAVAPELNSQITAKPFTNALNEGQKAFYSLGAIAGEKSVAAPTGATADGFVDKAALARGGGIERDQSSLNSQAYSNIGAEQLRARKKEAPSFNPATAVLTNFKIEQQGSMLRVIDGDGSTYRGVVDEHNTLYKQIVERQNKTLSNSYNNQFRFQTPKLADNAPGAKQQDANYYLYRVEGTNRTLNQNVVFSWNFVDTNNTLAAAQFDSKAAAQKLDATKLPSQFPALLQNSYINGRAQFGEGREIEVIATPVKQ